MDNSKKQANAPSVVGVIHGSIMGAAVTHEMMDMTLDSVDVYMSGEVIDLDDPDDEVLEVVADDSVIYADASDSDLVRFNMPVDTLESLALSGTFGATDSDMPDYFNDADVSAFV